MLQFNPTVANKDRLASETFTTDRKKFFVDLHENERGQFVRITEAANGRRDRIMVPSTALREMVSALNRIITFSEENYTPAEN